MKLRDTLNKIKKGYIKYSLISIFIICVSVPLISCERVPIESESEGESGSIVLTSTTAVITISASPASIPADGVSSAAITAILKDATGTAVPLGTPVTFTTTLGTFQNDLATYDVNTPGDNGTIIVSLISSPVAGDAEVTAESNSVTQMVTLEFTESEGGGTSVTPTPASIELYSVQREYISVTGSGEPETSKITLVVKDIDGLRITDPNITVNFSIVGVGGGESLSNLSDTISEGYVDTTLQSGTIAGTVKIQAELSDDPSISTNVSVTIVGGPPYGENLGLNPETLNIPGLVYYGRQDTMTTRVSDKYFNNVPDGTSIYFTTDYAGITGQDTTESNGGAIGSFATAILTSQVPDPPDGFLIPATSTQSGDYARVLCVAIDSGNSDIIYLGTDGGGIFKTTTGGTNWSQIGLPEKGLTNGIVWDIEIDPENSAIIYAATNDGVFRSQGSGDEWEKVSKAKQITGEDLGDLDTTDADNDGYSDDYTLTYSSNMIRSKTYVYLDGVETDKYVYTSTNTIRFIVKSLGTHTGLPGDPDVTIDYTTTTMIPSNYPIHALALRTNPLLPALNPLFDRTLYAGTDGKGVYQSTDSGFSWAAKNSGLSDQDVLSLAIDPTNNDILYAGTRGGGVFKTIDSAATWGPSNVNLLASVIHAITIDPGTTSRIYVGTEQNGVYYSTNSGATWTAPTTNVTSTRVTKIVLDSTANPATEIYAATYGDGTDPLGGVYKSDNSGVTWSRLSTLVENHVHALGIIPGATDTLLAGTWGRNFFKSINGGTTWTLSNGSAPNELTNQIFATSRVLFSGHTAATGLVQTITTGQGAGGDDYLNDGFKRSCIYHNGSAYFIYAVQDENGNPLVAGTSISASVDHGMLTGNKSETLPDKQTNTNYSLAWTNNIIGDENLTGTLSITVTSENGNLITNYALTLIRPVAVTITPAEPAQGNSVTVIPTGGSETKDLAALINDRGGYTIRHPHTADPNSPTVMIEEACSYGSTVLYTAGAKDAKETVIVTDGITGEYAELSYTVK